MADCILCGVGGQGTVLAGKLIATAALLSGKSVRGAETIGMAQRGGSVMSCLRIAGHAPACVFHTHSTTNFIMDKLVQNPYVDIVQVTKDAGTVPVGDMIRAMQTIQAAGKAVLFKGRLTYEEALEISRSVDKRGLCLGVVTDTNETADETMEMLRSINW